jgi:hypothetical protein
MNTVDEFDIARGCHESVDNLRRGGRLERAYQRVFEIEGVPDLAELFRAGSLSTKALPKLRAKSDAQKLRRWMREVSADQYGADAGSEYLAAAARERGFWASNKGRAAKTMIVSALSLGAGAVLGGPVAAVVGAAAGPLLVDAGMDLIDEFVLTGILSGWRPRNYFENVIYPKE